MVYRMPKEIVKLPKGFRNKVTTTRPKGTRMERDTDTEKQRQRQRQEQRENKLREDSPKRDCGIELKDTSLQQHRRE